ncbi:YdcF family protein [Comamonas endophytica]|uniref:YdcF family protein n=1 Tax=Comamonas endophytica TaxID=2949090 RepID=A0ABY6GFI1_9BURK|nr:MULTISPECIES: YdcF family protein [unclassified Acidovorax]MCD2513386.1 YdcF family protein [Acidovorax sp. D4N7]UYG53831.1 YdcF family protein [Acidovorax sp. 5MLIR]
MILSLLIILALLGAACMARCRKRMGQMLYALALGLFFAVGCGVVPAWLLQDLQSAYEVKPSHAWGQRNAIVVLGGGMERVAATGGLEPGLFSYARLVEAAALQRECVRSGGQCKILLSGGDAQRTGSSEAMVYRQALLALGLAGDDVLIEPISMSTWQHARYASDVLQHFCADHVVLVSSGVHLRRSQLYFAHFGIEATQVRADYLCAQKSLLPRPHNFVLADAALHEYLEIARYRIYIALGERAPPPARLAAG